MGRLRTYHNHAFRKRLGHRLRLAREQEQLTQAALGAHARVSKQQMSRWESGQRLPSLEVLILLAQYLPSFVQLTLEELAKLGLSTGGGPGL